MSFNKEIELFHELAVALIAVVERGLKSNRVTQLKKATVDYTTEVDVSVEDTIVEKIRTHFPQDDILAEEGYSETKIGDKRIWIIDSICGSSNMAHGMPFYCSNIALVNGGKVVAACVVDIHEGKYYWSVENDALYEGLTPVPPTDEVSGMMIDVDFGCWYRIDERTQNIHRAMMAELLKNKGIKVFSINTSLSMLYVALRKYDAHFVINTHPWDFSAGSFLAMQAGCVVSAVDGTPWGPKVNNVMIASNPKVYKVMRDAYDAAVAQVR